MKIEVNKVEDIYEIKFIKGDGNLRSLKLTSESYTALESYFKPKTKRKDKQPAPAPKIEDVREYFKSKNCTLESANKFHEYYETTGWRGADGKPVLNWKGKALSVWINEKNKIKEVIKSESSFFRD